MAYTGKFFQSVLLDESRVNGGTFVQPFPNKPSAQKVLEIYLEDEEITNLCMNDSDDRKKLAEILIRDGWIDER